MHPSHPRRHGDPPQPSYPSHPSHSSDLSSALRAALDPDPVPVLGEGDRPAGVLVPLIEGAEPSMVFTRRTEHLSRHAGEISFPGGLQDPGDAGPRAAALREAHEEIGLEPGMVDILGALPPVHTTVSAIVIVPFVGILSEGPVFTPSESEIAELLEFPVARLNSAESRVEWPVGEHVYRGYAYELDGSTIWGATARILHDFLTVARRETPWMTPT